MLNNTTLTIVVLDVYLCKDCAWINECPEGNGHFWWHTLLPFNSRILQPGEDATEIKHTSGSSLESKLDILPVASGEGTDGAPLLVHALPPSNTSAALPETSNFASVATPAELTTELSTKIALLENKVGQQINAVEARLTDMEKKLDRVVAQLDEVVEALVSSRS